MIGTYRTGTLEILNSSERYRLKLLSRMEADCDYF